MIANDRVWTMGALLLTAVVLVAGWFLGVSPMLSQASASAAERADAVVQNSAHEVKLASLKERYESLDEIQSALDAQRRVIPSAAKLPEFVGQLSRVQNATGVALTDLTVSDAIPFAPVGAEEPVPDAPAEDAALPAAEPGYAESSGVDAGNFVAIPISISVSGDFAQVMSFVSGIQRGERLFLMSDLSVVEESLEGAFAGDLSGYVYVLIDDAVAESAPVSPADPTQAAAD